MARMRGRPGAVRSGMTASDRSGAGRLQAAMAVLDGPAKTKSVCALLGVDGPTLAACARRRAVAIRTAAAKAVRDGGESPAGPENPGAGRDAVNAVAALWADGFLVGALADHDALDGGAIGAQVINQAIRSVEAAGDRDAHEIYAGWGYELDEAADLCAARANPQLAAQADAGGAGAVPAVLAVLDGVTCALAAQRIRRAASAS